MQQQCYISLKRFSELTVLRLWSSGMCCFAASTQDTMPVAIYHKYMTSHHRKQEPMFGYSFKITIKHTEQACTTYSLWAACSLLGLMV